MTIRIVSWNCHDAISRKAAELLDLRPDIAIVQECGQEVALGDGELVRVAWTGTVPTKGMTVFARPSVDVSLDATFDPTLRSLLPIRVGGAAPMSILAVWSMTDARAGEPPPK